LIRFNCGRDPRRAGDAELFGHARGAFTGAVQARRGFFAEANGGTLVLDEIGELPTTLQPKLLRALQQGEIQPVGAGRVEAGRRAGRRLHPPRPGRGRWRRPLREDLYYRLAVLEVVVPPLREHREDIPALAAEFARRHAAALRDAGRPLRPELIDALQRLDWPGNVRQLENAVARIVALSSSREIGLEGAHAASAAPTTDADAEAPPEGTISLREQLEAVGAQPDPPDDDGSGRQPVGSGPTPGVEPRGR